MGDLQGEKKNANKGFWQTRTDQSRNAVKQHAHNPRGSQGISIFNAIGIQPCDVLI